MVLCDTNIFIHAFNGDAKTISTLQSIGYDNILLSSITVMELYQGMGNKKELQEMKKKSSTAMSLKSMWKFQNWPLN